jgi:serine/threonine-protein kinase RsbW
MRNEAVAQSAGPVPRTPPAAAWHAEAVHTTTDVEPAVRRLTERLAAHGYSAAAVFAAEVALTEALANALVHGNKGDPRKRAHLRYRVSAEELVAEVRDEGGGFDPLRARDPLAEENLERAGGRGLFLMRSLMSSVRYNERGDCVVLTKQRGPSSPAQRQ